ncbi:NUDIX hydrolase [Streptomyces sp. NPDC088557]|uniref:NUDIX hydrolase n=1 Tax=Streptomyces sp. NPDC088557 TaxID=3365867 RepID=UPI0037F53A72
MHPSCLSCTPPDADRVLTWAFLHCGGCSYSDWSHPKGKRKRAESAESCALREVLEETGQHCALGTRLPTVRYAVDGRPKEVDYWAARALGGAFAPSDEVDALRWLAPARARALLTRDRDRELLDALPIPAA